MYQNVLSWYGHQVLSNDQWIARVGDSLILDEESEMRFKTWIKKHSKETQEKYLNELHYEFKIISVCTNLKDKCIIVKIESKGK